MTQNTNQYCEVIDNAVAQGPRRLPTNYVDPDTGKTYFNINNSDLYSDADLLSIGWYPYVLVDSGAPSPPPDQYNRTLSDMVIGASNVVQEAQYTEYTQQQYDQSASTTVTNSQRVATDLARQTEEWIQQDDNRLLTSRPPLIPATERADVEAYLGTLYDSMDDETIPPTEPPGATRQITVVPGEAVDRAAIRRYHVEFGGFNYYEIEYTLYTNLDATGMSLWIERQNGTYLFTLSLVDQGNGVWSAVTDKQAGMPNNDDFRVALFKGVKISQDFDLPVWDDPSYPLILDVRWLDNNLAAKIAAGEV